MLLHAGFEPNQQGDKSIQQENYVTGHPIDQHSAPALGAFLLCPSFNVIDSLCCASLLLPFDRIKLDTECGYNSKKKRKEKEGKQTVLIRKQVSSLVMFFSIFFSVNMSWLESQFYLAG